MPLSVRPKYALHFRRETSEIQSSITLICVVWLLILLSLGLRIWLNQTDYNREEYGKFTRLIVLSFIY